MNLLRTRLVGLALTLAACGGNKEPVRTVEPMPTAPPGPIVTGPVEPPAPAAPALSMEEVVKKHVAEREAAWAAHDGKKASALYAADAVFGSGSPTGWQETKATDMEKNLGAYFAGFPDAKLTTTRVVAKGNVAVVEWIVAGTNTGELMGEKATGKKVATRGASVVWFGADGKVTRENVYMDVPTTMGQLGKGPKGQKFRAADSIVASPVEWLWSKPGDETVEASAKSFYGALEKKDAKAAFAMVTDDVVLSSQYDAADVKGRKDVEKTMNEGMKAFVDDKYEIKGCYGAGAYVACEYVWTATWKNAAMGMKPTGKTGTVHVLEVFKTSGGKMQQATAYGNGLEFAATFGLLPDPKKGEKAPAASTTGTPKSSGAGEPKAPAAPAAPATPAKK